MKKDTHPLSRSCANTKDTITWEDGNEYPLVKLEISNQSHPFFTGKMKFVDTAGRIDKFNKKFAKFGNRKKAAEPAADEIPAEAPAEETAE